MIFANPQLQPLWQILLVTLLGSFIGLEREYKRKGAGLKTFSLVGVGSCIFTLVAVNLANLSTVYFGPTIQMDPGRIIQAVAIGVGFIGAGLIIHRETQVEGLTTAAALWATSAIGVAVGLRLYLLGLFGAFTVVGILSGFRIVEKKLFHKFLNSKDAE